MATAPVNAHPPCYNSFRKAAKEECMAFQIALGSH
jgi:hypothetical protein